MTKSGDERFGAELSKTMPALRGRALALTRNAADASDLVQKTLLKAWKGRSQFREGTNLRAWLLCIMRNTFMSDLRVKGRETPEGLYDFASGVPEPAAQNWALVARKTREAIAALPADQAEAIVFVGAMGGSYHEAADRFGSPEGTIKSRVCRARQALRESLEAEDLFVGGMHF